MRARESRLLSVAAVGLAAAAALAGCSDDTPPRGPSSLSTLLRPTMSAAYYVDQANRYFDALDDNGDHGKRPTYSKLAARWEWPPWLLLTGIGGDAIHKLDDATRVATPSTVPQRDCRFFDEQPFARCYVVFDYPGKGKCPIYEEFTFNDAGEMTFIEAWSDLPGFRPMNKDDRWAEGDDVDRLSTRIPGLGNTDGGLLDLQGDAIEQAAQRDADVANFLKRARSFGSWWLKEYTRAGDDLFPRGCGWK